MIRRSFLLCAVLASPLVSACSSQATADAQQTEASLERCGSTDVAACTDYLYQRTTLTRDEARALCSQGVHIECIDFLYSRTGLDRVDSARHCRGGVTVECITDRYSRSADGYAQAALWCAGNDPACADPSCVDYLYSRTPLSRPEAEAICRNGVLIECIEHLYSRTPLDRVESARHCQGYVTVTCIEDRYGRSGDSRPEAALWCAANGGR